MGQIDDSICGADVACNEKIRESRWSELAHLSQRLEGVRVLSGRFTNPCAFRISLDAFEYEVPRHHGCLRLMSMRTRRQQQPMSVITHNVGRLRIGAFAVEARAASRGAAEDGVHS